MYYDKWWKNHGHVKAHACNTKKTVDQKAMANALGVVNIGGIFVVLLCGLALAVLVAIVEFCWSNHLARSSSSSAKARQSQQQQRNGHQQQPSLCQEMLQTLAPYLFGSSSARRNSDADQLGNSSSNGTLLGGIAAAAAGGGRSREDCSSCSFGRQQTNL